MLYTNQYVQLLNPEYRVSRANIFPRNIYRISTYSSGNPKTKTGLDSRYVFVIGKVADKIHCIKLNDIPPFEFIKFLNKIRDINVEVNPDKQLSEHLKRFSLNGSDLFERHIKTNPKIYKTVNSNYRTYFIKNIQNVWEIRFEDKVLRDLFSDVTPNLQDQQTTINTEIIDNNG